MTVTVTVPLSMRMAVLESAAESAADASEVLKLREAELQAI